MSSLYLRENLTFDQARVQVLHEGKDGKDLFMKGICIQGGIKNANQRVYPVNEIQKAVKTLNDQITSGYSVLGEVDHPDDLKINLDRVSHMITEMWMDGPNGYGKMKILPTPMGQLVRTMLESGVKLGVSSRGSGNISEYGGGEVSDFEIITVDVVAQPSAPGAYPTAIYEHLMNTKGGNMAMGLAAEVRNDKKSTKSPYRGINQHNKRTKIMFDAISKLVESGVIGEDTKKSIEEAWDSKIKENRELVTAELREEFAKRYEHDKNNMVEAIDTMMTEKLSEEISKFVEDRKALAQEKITYKESVGAHSKKLEEFVLSKLTNEVKELHDDRKSVGENFAKLEEFVVNALAKEIKEFAEDKKSVVETKVKLVKEAKAQLAKLKESFIKKSAKVVEDAVTKKLGEEISQLKEDISSARQVNFGKQIFEAFASEYQASYLNEKSETSKLLKVVDETTLKLKNAEKSIEEAKTVIESKEREISQVKDLMERKATMAELLKPLSKDKAEVMGQLLESTETGKLKAAYDKYLQAVMEDAPVSKAKKMLSEASGDKAGAPRSEREDAELGSIRVLAGLSKINN